MRAWRLAIVLAAVAWMSDVASAVTSAGEVLGFEKATDWSTTTSGVTIGLSATHTQGASSLAVHPANSNGWTPLFSVPLSTLGTIGTTAAIDVMLPMQQANAYWYGAVQMYINCPSHNIYTAYLAQVELTGKPLGVWNTLTFPLTGSEVSSLLASGYSDLTFEVVLNVQVPTTGTYLFDNLRFLPVAANGCGGEPNGTFCNDGNACTGIDICEGGTCVGSSPLICNDDNACTADRCDPTLGCVHTPIPCSVRSGQIEAESFDVQSGIVTTATFVTPTSSGAWVQFNNVDFGAAGTTGRFEVSLIGSPGNRHIQLHLNSPTGPLVADLLSLPSAATAPVPQAVNFLIPEFGVQTVVIVFGSSDAGSLDWFLLEPARRQATLTTFPPTFQHSNPGQQPILTNVPVLDADPSESDVPPVTWFYTKSPISLPPAHRTIVPLQTSATLMIAGQARWSGPSAGVSISVVNSLGQILATGGSTAVPGGWRADVVTPPLTPQQLGVLITNNGTSTLSVQVLAGAVQ